MIGLSQDQIDNLILGLFAHDKSDKRDKTMEKVEIEEIPTQWGPACEYCKAMAKWGSTHEDEIMSKARKICNNPLFPEIVYAGLDTLDHAKATPTEQLRYLLKMHDRTNCGCLDKITEEVQNRTIGSKDIDAWPSGTSGPHRADSDKTDKNHLHDISCLSEDRHVSDKSRQTGQNRQSVQFSPLDLANFVKIRKRTRSGRP